MGAKKKARYQRFCLLILALGLSAISARTGSGYGLSDYERRGLYFCSTEGTLDAVADKDGFYMLIFLQPLTLSHIFRYNNAQ